MPEKHERRPAAEAGAEEALAAAAAEETQVEERPVEGDGADPQQQVEEDLDELVKVARERDEYLQLAQRTQADFENFRKRIARDAAAAETRGLMKLARELLPALDNLARALAAAEPRDEEDPEHHLAEGIRLVQAELTAALGRVGIEAYSPEGEPFDPVFHEAMAQQPVEGAEPGTVVEVYEQGYRIDGTVIRPARVVVAA